MFDFSFGKLAIIFALCLMVLGPEKLPKLAQTLGRFAGQARAMARHFRTQLEQEIAAGELAKQKQELEATLKSTVDTVSSPITTTAQAMEEIKQEFLPVIDPSAANGSGHGDYEALTSTEVASAAEPTPVAAPTTTASAAPAPAVTPPASQPTPTSTTAA